jgi:hypothetical protein
MAGKAVLTSRLRQKRIMSSFFVDVCYIYSQFGYSAGPAATPKRQVRGSKSVIARLDKVGLWAGC